MSGHKPALLAAAHPFLACLASWAVLAGVTWRSPEGLHFYDPVVQLMAVKQYEAGLSPSWNVFMRVSPDNLAESRPEWIAWWPPSTQLGILPFLKHGWTPAAALRAIALTGLALGSLGWVRWFRFFGLPRGWILAWAVLVPWSHEASNCLFRYSAGILAFAAAPWLLELAARWLRASRRAERHAWRWALATGLAAAAAYWLKYSLFVVAMASIGSVLLGMGFRRPGPNFRLRQMGIALFVLLLAAAGPLSLAALGRASGATPLWHGGRHLPDATGLAYLVANPALAAADAFAPLFFLLVRPGWSVVGAHTMIAVASIGVPFGLVFAWLLIRSLRAAPGDEFAWVAVLTLGCFSAALFALWSVADVSHEPRLFVPAALAALPAALAAGRQAWPGETPLLRGALAVALAAFVVFPVVLGPFYVAAKVAGEHPVRPGPTGLSLPALDRGDTPALLAVLKPQASASSVWVVVDPEEALELPGRSILLSAGRGIAGELQHLYSNTPTLASWRSSRPVTLLALLPGSYGSDAAPPVLTSARRVARWTKTELPADSNLVLWSGTFAPQP